MMMTRLPPQQCRMKVTRLGEHIAADFSDDFYAREILEKINDIQSLTCLRKLAQLQIITNAREDIGTGRQKKTSLTQTRHVF